MTVTLYNQVRETILDVEYPLIEHQLRDIDQELEKAIAQLNWTSEGKKKNVEMSVAAVRRAFDALRPVHNTTLHNALRCVAFALTLVEMQRNVILG